MSGSTQTWCWYCKQEIPGEADICPTCGKPLNDSMKVIRCGNCGKYLLKSIGVCDACGTPLEGAPSAAMDPRRIPDNLDALDAAAQHSAAGRPAGSMPRWLLPVIIAGGVLLIAVLVLLIILLTRPAGGKEAPEPVYCAEEDHEWQEADCTHPRTCAICGKTEGEALGHDYVMNVCTRCGAYEKPFYFYDSASMRNGATVVFSGSIMNYSGMDVKSLTIKLDLYDAEKNRVASETIEAVNGEEPLHPLAITNWSLNYNDSAIKWKYWRISAIDFVPADD